jgi:D-cysteine desulfhydrase
MRPNGIPEKSCVPILLKEYPELEERIPRISLGKFPTPVQQLHQSGFENLWIKRDDMSSSVYGGNKIRKLEFILGQARKENAAHIITFGGIGTNHGLATAVFCKKLEIKCTLLLFWQPVTPGVKHNLLLFNKYKAETIYKKTLWNTVVSYYLLQRLRHPRAYFVYAGGSNPGGTIGYVNAVFELKAQIQRGEAPEPGVIICPLGSGGTLAGLALGLQLTGLQTKLKGVRVAKSHLGPFQACTPNTVAKLMHQTYSFLKQRCQRLPPVSIRAPEILHDYFGDGYGVPTRAASNASRLLKEREGIRLDMTYTAKAFAAVYDCCQSQAKPAAPVLYWHTYNSVDLADQANSVDYRQLPKPLQRFFEKAGEEGHRLRPTGSR